MAGNVIQDVMVTGDVYDFIGDPLTGTNRLVSTFTVVKLSGDIIQDVFTSESLDVIQDELG